MSAWIASIALATVAAEPAERTWTIDGVERRALIYVPDGAATKSAPGATAGLSGSGRSAARP